MNKPPETPFPRHWRYYIVLKYAVMAAAALLAFLKGDKAKSIIQSFGYELP